MNDDTGSTIQTSGKLGIDGQGNFVVVWRDYRLNHSNNDFYCQLFNSNAQRIGNNYRINSSLTTWGGYAKIAVRKNGSFAICWNDTLVRLKIYNRIGNPISPEITVNDIPNSNEFHHSVSCDTLGNFIVVWEKPILNSGININFQRFDSLGNKIGNDVKVNEDTASNIHHKPSISIRSDGSFIIAWEKQYSSYYSDYYSIYMQIFDKNGIKIGTNVRVFNRTDTMDQQTHPLISSDDSGRFCIGFTNYDFSVGDFDALSQMYNSNGTPNGGPIYIDISGYDEFFQTIFKRKNGDFIVGYHKEFSLGPKCQRYNANGQLIGIPFLMSNQALSSGKYYDDVAIYNDRIISIWSDQRNGTDGDIYCNIRSFQKPDSIITIINNISNSIPKEIKLFQNYPNPFNSKSKIKISIPENEKWKMENGIVALKVYDILGKEVKTLINEKLKPGTYEVIFDGSNLSSGLFYYTLIEDGKRIDTKKLILLK